jgi:hypothetical protein
MDYIVPWYIASSAAGVGAITRLPGPSADINGELVLNVVAGGPVFLWRGRRELRTAYDTTHGASDPDFDIACSATGESVMEVSGGLETMTLFSDTESIGYIRVQVREESRAVKMLEELIAELRKGIIIPRDAHIPFIPVQTGAPRLAPMRGEDAC